MKILRDYDDINRPLITVISILLTLLVSVTVVAMCQALGLAFKSVAFPASGPLALHAGVMAFFFWQAKKLLSKPYETLSVVAAVGSGLFNMAMYGIMALNTVLVGVFVFNFEVHRLWIIAMAVPALVAWWVQDQLDAHSTAKDEYLEEQQEEEYSDAEVYAEITKASPLQTLLGGLDGIKWQLITIMLTVLFILVGFIYYYYLSAAFLDDDIWSFSRIGRVISGSIEGMVPTIIGIVAAITLIFGSISLWKAFSTWRLKKQQDDIDRELSDHEVDLIDHCTHSLEDYAASRKYPSIVKYVYWLVWIGWFCVMAGAVYYTIVGNGLGASLFKSGRVEGLEWFIYIDGIGVTEILMIFILIIGYFAFFTHLFRNWTDLTEHNLLKTKTEHYDPDELLGKLREDLAMDVRKYMITNKLAFDPAAYLKLRGKSYGKLMNIATGALLFVTMCFWILDRRDYELITEEYVEYTDYWSGEQYRQNLADVQSVRITCRANKKDNLDIGYDLIVSNYVTINIVTNGREANERLGDLEALDEILQQQGIGKIAGSNNKFPSLFNAEECADQLSSREVFLRDRLLLVFSLSDQQGMAN